QELAGIAAGRLLRPGSPSGRLSALLQQPSDKSEITLVSRRGGAAAASSDERKVKAGRRPSRSIFLSFVLI
ncbi:MAG: hypothetical protein ACYC8T_29215, partial [Myxococcaceae bacterium]